MDYTTISINIASYSWCRHDGVNTIWKHDILCFIFNQYNSALNYVITLLLQYLTNVTIYCHSITNIVLCSHILVTLYLLCCFFRKQLNRHNKLNSNVVLLSFVMAYIAYCLVFEKSQKGTKIITCVHRLYCTNVTRAFQIRLMANRNNEEILVCYAFS